MVSDRTVTIEIVASTEEFQTEVDFIEERTDAVVKEWVDEKQEIEREQIETLHQTDQVVGVWRRVRTTVETETHTVIYAMRNTVALMSSVFSVFGIALDPLLDAMLQTIYVGLSTALAIHRMLEASTFGVASVVTIGLSMMAFAMSTLAIIQTTQGMNNAKQDINKTIRMTNDLNRLIESLGRM